MSYKDTISEITHFKISRSKVFFKPCTVLLKHPLTYLSAITIINLFSPEFLSPILVYLQLVSGNILIQILILQQSPAIYRSIFTPSHIRLFILMPCCHQSPDIKFKIQMEIHLCLIVAIDPKCTPSINVVMLT